MRNKTAFDPARRNVLCGIAAGGALALTAGAHDQSAEPAEAAVAGTHGRERTSVLVIGAGAAGLFAARTLAAAGRDFLVLEARERVGGRTLNQAVGAPGAAPGTIVEVGGQWVGPTQDYALKLIQELGLTTFKTYDEGRYLHCRGGRVTPYSGRIPPVAARATAALAKLEAMAAEVPLHAPWNAPLAFQWDGQTVQSWLNIKVRDRAAREMLELIVTLVLSASPRDVSLLHWLFYIRSAGSLAALVGTSGGAQDARIVGGSQLICVKMAQGFGERIRFSRAVREIRQEEGRVIACGEGFEVEAERAIVAIPPTLAGRIRYTPRLDGLRDQLTQRIPMGTTIKVQCVYPTPFWRLRGLSGQVTSDTGAVRGTFDNSPPDGRVGVLMGFIDGDEGRRALSLSKTERQRLVIADFVRYFGSQAIDPLEYIEKDWADEEFSRGCYSGYFPPGVWTGYGRALRASCGRLHWAGTETSEVWNGYIDGALRSGERAAREVLGRQNVSTFNYKTDYT